MSNGVQLLMADGYLRRFIYQERLSLGLGYPKQAAFIDGKRSSGRPPPIGQDPLSDAIGQFYQSIQVFDREILEGFYNASIKVRHHARRIGVAVRTFYRRVRRLIADCAHWLEGLGYL